MGVKIGENTLLAGKTVLSTGEQINVSRAAAGDTKAPLAMAVTSAPNSPAYDPSWLDDPNGLVNVAMLKALIASGGVAGFDPEGDTIITGSLSLLGLDHYAKRLFSIGVNKNISLSVGDRDGSMGFYIDGEMDFLSPEKPLRGEGTINFHVKVSFGDGMLDIAGGSTGQFLQKTANGVKWVNISGSWNGGNVTNATTFQKDVTIGTTASAAWVRMANTNAGYTWENIPNEALPTKAQIDAQKLDKPSSGNIGNVLILGADGPMWGTYSTGGGGASTESILASMQTFYDKMGMPYDYTAGPHLPIGWYRIEAMFVSSNGFDASSLLNSSLVRSGNIQSVMGLAFCGTDNGGWPYVTLDGRGWFGQDGQPVSPAMCRSVQISLLYKHDLDINSYPEWMNSSLMGPASDISLMTVRYTAIGNPPEESRNYTTPVPTQTPTLPPTSPPEGETTLLPTETPK